MKGALIIAAALALACPSAAQDEGDGWDVESQPGIQIAGAAFSSGVALIFRCQAGQFEAIVTGLTPAEGLNRTLEISRPDGVFETQIWRTSATLTAAFSIDSARLARASRLGGALSIRTPAADGQPARLYRLDLPSDPAGLDAALTACGVALVDEGDAVQPPHTLPENLISWRTLPSPRYPERALGKGIEAGRVELTCVVTLEGEVRDCEIVSEDPPNAGFGVAAREAAENARMNISPDRRLGEGRINFPITFRLSELPPGRPRAAQ